MKKVGLVGSRSFADAKIVDAVVRRLVKLDPDVVVVSGGAQGADLLAEDAARRLCRRPPRIFLAEWSLHGAPQAAFIRNQKIVDESDEIVAFWTGKSNGTRDTLRRAIAAKKPVFIYLSIEHRWLKDAEIASFMRPTQRAS